MARQMLLQVHFRSFIKIEPLGLLRALSHANRLTGLDIRLMYRTHKYRVPMKSGDREMERIVLPLFLLQTDA
jgi:hypothetical protein